MGKLFTAMFDQRIESNVPKTLANTFTK